MPRFLFPGKSTPHRVAAIALYRALLSRCSTSSLPAEDRTSLQNVIRNKFRHNRRTQSPRELELLFRAGYETLDRLSPVTSDTNRPSSTLSALVSNIPSRLKCPPPIRRAIVEPDPPSTDKHPLAVLPPSRAVLNVRPYVKTSGPRHVPILSTANGIPFLRITKPQPPALSRVLRQKLDQRVERFERKVMFDNYWIPIAQQEDNWDAILQRDFGFSDQTESHEGQDGHNNSADEASQKPVTWADPMLKVAQKNSHDYRKDFETTRAISKKMLAIVDEEKRLAQLEGVPVVRGRKRRPIRPRWPT